MAFAICKSFEFEPFDKNSFMPAENEAAIPSAFISSSSFKSRSIAEATVAA